MESFGRPALIGIKLVMFGGFFVLWRLLNTPGRLAVPIALTIVGVIVTGWNLVMITTAM